MSLNAPPLQSDEVAVYDDGTEILRCTTPSLDVHVWDVSISLNAQDFSLYPIKFTALPHALLNGILPSSGPRTGNTSITISGSHFLTPALPTPSLVAAVDTHGLDFVASLA